MSAIGGSIRSVTLDGRSFSVAADADASLFPGGFQNEVQANGDGTGRMVKTQAPSSLSDVPLSIDNSLGDLQFIQELANRNDFFAVTMTLADGSVYQGNAQITGEPVMSTQNSTVPVSLMGTGPFTLQ